jgi:nitrite reductase/ring-hydroxylating ferredoxin subunit
MVAAENSRGDDARLCALADIPDGGSAGIEAAGLGRGYLALRRGASVFVYVNSCPHIGAPLDFRPGQFLNLEKTHILCSLHGALFNIEDGRCVAGPCAGDRLQAVATVVRDGILYPAAVEE